METCELYKGPNQSTVEQSLASGIIPKASHELQQESENEGKHLDGAMFRAMVNTVGQASNSYSTSFGFNSCLPSYIQCNQLHSSIVAHETWAPNDLPSPSHFPSHSSNRNEQLYSTVPVRYPNHSTAVDLYNLPGHNRPSSLEPPSTTSFASPTVFYPNSNSNEEQVNYHHSSRTFLTEHSNPDHQSSQVAPNLSACCSHAPSSPAITLQPQSNDNQSKEIKTEYNHKTESTGNCAQVSENNQISTLERVLPSPICQSTSQSTSFDPVPSNQDIYHGSVSEGPSSSLSINSKLLNTSTNCISENSTEDRTLFTSNFLDVGQDENTDKSATLKKQRSLVILSKQDDRYLVQWSDNGQQDTLDEAFLQKESPESLKRFSQKRVKKRVKKKSPKINKTKARMVRQKKVKKRLVSQVVKGAASAVYRYNPNYRVVNYVKNNSNMITYQVDKRDKGMRTMSSNQVRKVCPINLIHFLESKVHIRKSLPFETVVRYAQKLKKYL